MVSPGPTTLALRDALARGSEFALLLNNDTFAAPDFIAQMLAVMDSDLRTSRLSVPKFILRIDRSTCGTPAAISVCGPVLPSIEAGRQLDRNQFDDESDITQATGCAMLVRASAMREHGLLDERFWIYSEDLDWSVRFLKAGYRLALRAKSPPVALGRRHQCESFGERQRRKTPIS